MLDQPADLMEGIKLWRYMRHVKDLMDKEDYDTINNSPSLVRMMTIIDMGEDEANAMIAAAGKSTETEGADAVS